MASKRTFRLTAKQSKDAADRAAMIAELGWDAEGADPCDKYPLTTGEIMSDLATVRAIRASA